MTRQRAASLTFLACGSLFSEVASLYRGTGHVTRPSDGSLRLLPAPDFSAKNEHPQQRREPLTLHCLGPKNVPLCPACALSQYLETAYIGEGPLLRKVGSENPLSNKALGKIVVGLVLASNTASLPKLHDIHKVPTSCPSCKAHHFLMSFYCYFFSRFLVITMFFNAHTLTKILACVNNYERLIKQHK